ncbi:hypothetical protein Sango_2868700 [Sesamum angolense]|uniref:Retrotransposon gag domain-containing protein n=1 Tax=Sesamum angolense TaxID=2727404 RepID=A0AAE1W0E1_9LAMI|nr:hypothetical protein Sango_2868700 [Sesamum angolense]
MEDQVTHPYKFPNLMRAGGIPIRPLAVAPLRHSPFASQILAEAIQPEVKLPSLSESMGQEQSKLLSSTRSAFYTILQSTSGTPKPHHTSSLLIQKENESLREYVQLFFEAILESILPNGDRQRETDSSEDTVDQFQRRHSRVVGEIMLLVSRGSYPRRTTKFVKFFVVDSPSAYNVILGRPSLNIFQAVASTYHLKIKFPTHNRIREEIEDRRQARECCANTLKTPVGDPTKVVKIGSLLGPQFECILIDFLQNHSNVFTWKSSDMQKLSPEVMVHQLNVNPEAKPIKQKKRAFGTERNKIIKGEVEKLLQVNYIRHVQYLEWLANVVLVPKSNGKWRMYINFTNLN